MVGGRVGTRFRQALPLFTVAMVMVEAGTVPPYKIALVVVGSLHLRDTRRESAFSLAIRLLKAAA